MRIIIEIRKKTPRLKGVNFMLGCVILNFNDSETTKKLVNNIKSYTVIDYIIIVDNKSTDTSFLELKNFEN